MPITPIKINADGPGIESERVVVFTITKDGQDTDYTIPRVISGGTALQALEVYVKAGHAAMTLWLAAHALGEEGMGAVLESDHLTLEQARDLLTQIGEQYAGPIQELGKE